ncbi:MAG: PaaI family thioesterase [Candidatus Bostrichicola ureolyticus]|nr:MAG: PaaI family thioesterase [Candidatus Bostrichicola ureolyticus]
MNEKSKYLLKWFNTLSNKTLIKNITYIELGSQFLIAKMPIQDNLRQPMGFLHGGVIVYIAESIGSMLSISQIDYNKFYVFTLEISANYIRNKKDGEIYAKAYLIHKGKTTHFIQIKVLDEYNNIISKCKMTNIIISKNT